MGHANLLADTSFEEHQRLLADFERDLVITLGLLDDIRRERLRAHDDAGASFLESVSEALIAFANIYLCRLA